MGLPTVRLYLDNRKCKGDTLAQVKIALGYKSRVAYLMTNVRVRTSQWDAKCERVIKHPQKVFLTDYLNQMRAKVDGIIIRLCQQGALIGKTASDIKRIVEDELEGRDSTTYFLDYYASFCEKHKGRTKEIYEATLKKLCEYKGCTERCRFEDITPAWLQAFDKHLSECSPSVNSRSIHLRNIRAVVNDAIKNDLTDYYPFKKFTIKSAPTVKRSLAIDQIRDIFSIQDSKYQYLIDMFKLMFLLIGINLTDLYHLTNINNGRIEYYRAKTHKPYSINVEPEAMELIEKYRGKNKLLDISERYKTCKSFTTAIDKHLKQVLPNLSTYWARHTWATVAAELDIPIETISHALGHSYGSEVTAIYVRFNEKKVDEANRKVINYVLKRNNPNNI